MTVEALVTVHDSSLFEDCERRFACLPHRYVFVGTRPVVAPAGVEVIVARDYEPNYEHLPAFYDFTGWYVLAKHELIEADHLITLQYDMHIADFAITWRCSEILDTPGATIAFAAGHKSAGNWMLGIPGFEETFRRGMAVKGVDMDSWPDFDAWPSTQGTAWRLQDFVDFVAWFEPLFDVFAPSMWAGHLAERCVKAWGATVGRSWYHLPGVIRHEAADCHGTGALLAGRADVHVARAATFGR